MARHKTRDEVIAEEVSRAHPRTVLDIAYAHGPNHALTDIGAEVRGVDPLGRVAAYGATVRTDINIERLPFADGEFDAVCMGCVLSHLGHPLKALREIYRVLKPGGTFILSSTNPHYYWEIVLNMWYTFFRNRVSKSKPVEHFFEFTRYTMRTSLERCGFRLEKEIGVLFSVIKTNIRLNPARTPWFAFEIVYVARKEGTPSEYTIIEEEDGSIIRFKTSLF